jgi:hypothetical protein
MSKSIRVDESATAPCPFCTGGKYIIAVGNECFVMHTFPPRVTYMETDPMSFISMAGEELEKRGYFSN